MSFKVLSSVKSDKEVVKFYAVFRKPILTPSIEQRSIFATTESEIAAIKRWIYCKLLHLHIFIVAFSSNKHYRLKNCRIFIRNFEACVINASHFHNSADRLRFDLPTTEFTMNLNRNNQAVLATDLGDVLLDLSVILRYLIVYEALIMSHFEKIISKKICQTTWAIIAQAHPRFEPWSWHWGIHQIQSRHPKLTWCCTISCPVVFKHSGLFLKRRIILTIK